MARKLHRDLSCSHFPTQCLKELDIHRMGTAVELSSSAFLKVVTN